MELHRITTLERDLKRIATRKDLDSILASPALVKAFEAYLEAEFCSENLLFIQKVKKYTRAIRAIDDVINTKARVKLDVMRDEIQSEFLKDTSTKEAKQECLAGIENLKGEGAALENEEYRTASQYLFNECILHVEMVLVQDQVAKFQLTAPYQNATGNPGSPSRQSKVEFPSSPLSNSPRISKFTAGPNSVTHRTSGIN